MKKCKKSDREMNGST